MTVPTGPEKPTEPTAEPGKKKWEPAVVAAIISAVGAFVVGIMTAGSGLLSGIIQAKTTTVTKVETSTQTVYVTASSLSTSPPANGGPTSQKAAAPGDTLSLREVPPLGSRVFKYGRYSVAGQAKEPAMAGKVEQFGISVSDKYQMPDGYGTFRATVGLADGAPVDSTCTFEVEVDGSTVRSVIVLAGKTALLEAQVGSGKTFKLIASSQTAQPTAVWIEPVLVK
ncbi:NPCBM/NEW2 domain-containing protein [Crossiella cryophila]|uniref:Glycosyl hydrolase family 98 putative carbohydrate-binding module domain-containing protein n=1 Tax=Crossiella cryophila TaxID=43355 RepID=A0A7W7C8M9_9PSEU|nr:NPCBM/NEW2 domain-containing protein [Crossiella cryophila]MBB4675229.1 hypothetical protein [Crossiella cryophila]